MICGKSPDCTPPRCHTALLTFKFESDIFMFAHSLQHMITKPHRNTCLTATHGHKGQPLNVQIPLAMLANDLAAGFTDLIGRELQVGHVSAFSFLCLYVSSMPHSLLLPTSVRAQRIAPACELWDSVCAGHREQESSWRHRDCAARGGWHCSAAQTACKSHLEMAVIVAPFKASCFV